MPVDYNALAKQAGAISSTPPPSSIDYDALAKKAGAISSAKPAPVDPMSPGQPVPNAGAQMRANSLSAAAPAPAPKSTLDSLIQGAKDFAGGVGSQVNPATMVKGIDQAFYHPVDTAKGLVNAQGNLGGRAADEIKAGSYAEGIKHGLLYLLPGLGPQLSDMSDKAEHGHLAESLGEATGAGLLMAAPESPILKAGAAKVVQGAGKAAGAAVDATAPLRNAAADAFDTSAEKNIATALNPTKNVNKALVQNKIAEGLIDRKVIATSLPDLQEQAQAHMADYGQQIDNIFDQHADAGTALSPKPILAALDKEKQRYVILGENENPAYVAKIEEFQKRLEAQSNTAGGPISLDDLRSIRQIHDEKVAQSKGGFGLSSDAQSEVNAHKVYGNAIRSTFAEKVPELTDANKEFSFWANVDKVAEDTLRRKTGQKTSLTQKATALVGGSIGGALGHVLAGEWGVAPGIAAGSAVGSKLGAFQSSTLWNTASAQVKTRIADLLETGDEAGALAVAKRNGIVPDGAAVAADSVPTSERNSNAKTAASPASTSVPGIPDAGPNQEGQAVRAEVPPASQAQSGSNGTTVKVPGKPGPGYSAEYKLKELDAINGSHNGLTFSPNAAYKLTNDRNYTNAVNQGKVVNWSSPREFDPSFHITDNPDATNGPVVTDAAGNVIGGNGRAMIMQRVYNGNPKGAAAYRDLLAQKASQFGIDPEAVRQMKQPVLTREIPDSEFTASSTKQDAVTDFNKKGTAELTPGERAISDSRRVSTDTLDDMGGRLDAKGADATMSDVLEGKSGSEVLQQLVKDGVVSPQEQAAFADSNGTLNKAGRDRVSQLMIGRFFKDPAQLDSIAASVRGKVERMAAPLAQAESKGEWNLTPDVQSAIDLVERARQSGIKNIGDFIQQDGLFGKDKYTPEAVTIAKALQSSKSTELTAAVRQYAQDAAFAAKGDSMFGDTPKPEKSFADSIGKLKSGAASEAEKMTAKAPATLKSKEALL